MKKQNTFFNQISLMPVRLNFNDSDELTSERVSKHDSPKTPPNNFQVIPPMTSVHKKYSLYMIDNASPLLNKPEISNSGISINPFSPVGTELRSNWMDHNNSDNNNKKSSMSDHWFKNVTNFNLSHIQVTRYFKEFKVEKLIGKGDFGKVYKCINLLDGMPYAIKKTLQKVVGTKRENYAHKEVLINSMLSNHPNIVAYHSAWTENNSVFIQLEYCKGGNLYDMIFKKHHKFNDGAIEHLLSHLSNGLHYIHMSKMVHLDIKPSNIMISHFSFLKENKYEEDIIYKIGDFGHAAHSDILHDVEDGDSRYLPKEMLSGKYDSSTIMKVDIFSLGLTIYETVSASKLPSDGLKWHVLRDGYFPKEGSLKLSLLIANMIDPNPLNRPNAIDVYKYINLKVSKFTEILALQLEREYSFIHKTNLFLKCLSIKNVSRTYRRTSISSKTKKKRRIANQKSECYYSY